MTKLNVSRGHPDSAYHLSPTLCESDLIWYDTLTAHGITYLAEYMEATLDTADIIVQMSSEADDTLQGLMGIRAYDPLFMVGEVFLLSGEDLWKNHLLDLTRRFRRDILPSMCELYDSVVCTARAGNKPLLSWLVSAGFKPTRTTQVQDERFILMEYKCH